MSVRLCKKNVLYNPAQKIKFNDSTTTRVTIFSINTIHSVIKLAKYLGT